MVGNNNESYMPTPSKRSSNNSFKSLFNRASNNALKRSSLPVSTNRKNNNSQESFTCAGYEPLTPNPAKMSSVKSFRSMQPPIVPKRTTSLTSREDHTNLINKTKNISRHSIQLNSQANNDNDNVRLSRNIARSYSLNTIPATPITTTTFNNNNVPANVNNDHGYDNNDNDDDDDDHDTNSSFNNNKQEDNSLDDIKQTFERMKNYLASKEGLNDMSSIENDSIKSITNNYKDNATNLAKKKIESKTQINDSHKPLITHHYSPTVESLVAPIENTTDEMAKNYELHDEYNKLISNNNNDLNDSMNVEVNDSHIDQVNFKPPNIIIHDTQTISNKTDEEHYENNHDKFKSMIGSPTPRPVRYEKRIQSPFKQAQAQTEMKTSTPLSIKSNRMSLPIMSMSKSITNNSYNHNNENYQRPLTYPSRFNSNAGLNTPLPLSVQSQYKQLSNSSLSSGASTSSPSPIVQQQQFNSPTFTTPTSISSSSFHNYNSNINDLVGGDIHRLGKNELFRLLVDAQSELQGLKSRYGLEKSALEGNLNDTLKELNDVKVERDAIRFEVQKERQYVMALRRALHKDDDGIGFELEKALNSNNEYRQLFEHQNKLLDDQKHSLYKYKQMELSLMGESTNNNNSNSNDNNDNDGFINNDVNEDHNEPSSLILHNGNHNITSNLLGDVTAPFLNNHHKDINHKQSCSNLIDDDSFLSHHSLHSDIVVDIDTSVHDAQGRWTLGLDDEAKKA